MEVASQTGYDVFLSFRGEDTRMSFTSHLYDALTRNDIITYKDDKTLEIGYPIAAELVHAIELSRFAVVVLSSSFATSKWCLEEITKIVDCMKQGKLIVIPVFYHVSPSDVRHQSGCFKQGFANYEADPEIAPQKVETWRSAFREVGAISGLHVTQHRNESEAISEIIRKILKEVPETLAKRVDHIKKIMVHLECRSSKFQHHKDENDRSNKEIPDRLPSWLDDVKKVKEDVKSLLSNGHMGCFNVRERQQAAVKALKTIEKIEGLITEDLFWSDAPIPLGRVDSKPAIMSATSALPSNGDTQTRFKLKSRDATFNDALKLLQQDDKTRVIALCGMGGVGKTTMMDQLKSVAANKKMFKWIVTVAVGRNPDLKSIQHVVAVHTGQELTEKNEALRAEYLRKRFEKISEKKEKSLVILDDVWNKVELKDIGLSPLPNGVKLLLTSRDARICRQIAVDVNSVFQVVDVKVLQEVEARDFFYEITGVSELQHDMYEIGGNIVKKCGGLPLAIELIATTLKSEVESIWRDTLCSLEKNNVGKDVMEIIEISYNSMEKEEQLIFLLCGMFPEDSSISIEDLTRYAWGLKLLKDVSTLRDARYRTKRCVRNLTNAYLLIDGDSYHPLIQGVKIHDLVLAFVIDKVSKGEEPWIIDHRDMSMWRDFNMSTCCKHISLACKGGSKFPKDFKFPNLSILKLMQGDWSLKFPDDFYGEMKNLQVIAYNQMKHLLIPTLLQCSNLQTLCLHECYLTSDLSCIGNLLSLEVLSFANSNIKKLPSTFKNLKRLRLLDLTNCHNLITDDGVLENLDMLEELYMKVSDGTTINFTDDQWKELCVLSRKLSALDIEFRKNKAQLQKMSFEKLERFRISVGRFLGDMHAYENTLKLVMNTSKLHESKLNKLFGKTSVLLLKVNGMNNIEDIEPRSSPRLPSFNKLRDLVIQNCEGLMYLFNTRIAKELLELESLKISSCQIMEELIHIDSDEGQKITFPKLKRLILYDLPELLCLCNKANVIELLQLVDLKLYELPYFDSIYPKNQLTTSYTSTMGPLLNEQILIPKLERMSIDNMENLKEIWPCDQQVNVSSLREIKIGGCNSLVNLFPRNPMSLLQHLEELEVMDCDSIEVLFNIDMDCVREVECNSSLRMINAGHLMQLREIWRVEGVNNSNTISWFQAIETIEITECKSFRDVITPTTSSFDLRALRNLEISGSGESKGSNELVRFGREQEISVTSNEEGDELCDNNLNLMHNFNHLHTLTMNDFNAVEVVFEIDSPSSRKPATSHQQPLPLFPKLKELHLGEMKRMSHVWKCSNWNEFLRILPKQQQVSSFHTLTTIYMVRCNNIKYLFSSHVAELLSNLKKVDIEWCDCIEEVVSNTHDEDGEMTSTSSTSNQTKFLLDSLHLEGLNNLRHIGGGAAKGGSKVLPVDVLWSLCQYSKEIRINRCDALSILVPSYAARQMKKLKKVRIEKCKLEEVFETQGMNNNKSGDVGSSSTLPLPLSRLKNINNVPQLSSLREIDLSYCDLLEYVFTFSTLKSLTQLECLTIKWCKAMKEIVKRENGEKTMASSHVVKFPCLKSVVLYDLPNLLGLFLGKDIDFVWKSLEEVLINGCPRIEMFTSGHSKAKNLKFIEKDNDIYSLDCGLNFHQTPSPWPYHNLVRKHLRSNNDVLKVIPSNELLQVKKLEMIRVEYCNRVEEIFEVVMEGTNTAVEIPNLREIELLSLRNLKYIWKNMNRGRILEFPRLTTLEICLCDSLKHVITTSMLGSILQLQDLQIKHSKNIEVIVKEEEEECDGEVKQIELPHLKSLKLQNLSSLKGFCLGKEGFSFPSLKTLEIDKCPKLTVFTAGHTTTPELKEIDTGSGMCHLSEDLNSFLNIKL